LLVIALKQVKDGIPATDVTVSMIDYLLRQCAKWVDVVKPRYANSCPSPSIFDEAEQVMMDALKGVKERTVIDRDLSEGDTLRSLIFKHCRSSRPTIHQDVDNAVNHAAGRHNDNTVSVEVQSITTTVDKGTG
jgi:hypothetical protein